jgi:hypothetical protein
MNDIERQRRSFDFYSTLSPALQNQLAMQKRLSAQNQSDTGKNPPPISERYRFSKWYN